MLLVLDASAAMNRRIHQVQFSSRGRGAYLAQHMSSRVGVTTSGFRSQFPEGAIQSSGRVVYSVPAPVETEEVIPLEECCFSLQKQRLGLSKLMARGWGGGGSHGRRTQDNRINHMKNVTASQMEFLLGDEAGFEKLREPCITWGLFM